MEIMAWPLRALFVSLALVGAAPAFAAFCSRSAPLNSVESEMIAYMEKNKDWCQVPDDAISALKATHVKSVSFAAKACGVASQIKKMKEQAEKNAAAGGAGGAPQAQPLPAGPL
jgi:hypothetical protein